MEVVKKVGLRQCIEQEKRKLEEIRNNPEYNDGIQEDFMKQIERHNSKLKTGQESINLLKGRFTNQIMNFKEMIAKVLDKDFSLAEKIRTLFREQGITIASILVAIGMAIDVLVEALLPGGGGGTGSASAVGGKLLPKDDCLRMTKVNGLGTNFTALASLLGRLGVKAAEALPGIIGAILSWILNRSADVVGWILQNLWALVVSIGG